MNPFRIFAMVLSIILVLHLFVYFITSQTAGKQSELWSRPAADITQPRAPLEAKWLKNPGPLSQEAIESGRMLYLGAGYCYACHGKKGRGNGDAWAAISNPPPTDLTDPRFQTLRSDGELFWSIKEGVPESKMDAYVPEIITEEEAWKIVLYIRTL